MLQTQHAILARALSLQPLAKRIVNYLVKTGSISAREAMHDFNGMTSASLTRRMTDIEQAGIQITRERKTHPTTGRAYTRYSLKK